MSAKFAPREENAMNRNAFSAALLELQRGQFNHDEVAHRDIHSLLVPQRLTHFTLHFAKYHGRLVYASRTGDQKLIHRVLTDSLIIALAAANAMNLSLQQHFVLNPSVSPKGQSGRELNEVRRNLLFEFAEIVGNMAKSCEVLDHLESYPSRETLEKSTIQIVDLIYRLAQLE